MGDTTPTDVVVVGTGGWTWGDKMLQLVMAGCYPVGVLFVVFLSGPQPPTDVVPKLIGVAVLMGGIDLFVEAVASVRRVTIDSGGMTFRFLFHSERREWRDLEPSRALPKHGMWGVASRSRGGRPVRQRGYGLTVAQARAILDFPNGPAWDIPPATRRALEPSATPP